MVTDWDFLFVIGRKNMAINLLFALSDGKIKVQYPFSILTYTGDILLVGINYDRDTKEHQCLIEKYEKD